MPSSTPRIPWGSWAAAWPAALSRKGGPAIQREAMSLAPIAVGAAVVTNAGQLWAKHVIHAPTMEEPGIKIGDRERPAGHPRGALAAARHGFETIALPGMGTGLGGVDPSDAARAIVDELRAHRQPKPATVYLVDLERQHPALPRRGAAGSRPAEDHRTSVKILVPIKRVPNPEQKLKFAGGGLDLSGASWQVNPFDEYAVETALRLTEKGKGGEHAGEVVLVSIGPKDVTQQLRGAAGHGRRSGHPGGGRRQGRWTPTGWRASWRRWSRPSRPTWWCWASRRSTATPTRSGQLLAGYLGWPQATFLASVRAGRRRQVGAPSPARWTPASRRSGCRLPAVVTVDLRIIGKKAVRNAALAGADAEWEESQRYASLKGIMAAKKKEIRETTADALGATGAAAGQDGAATAPPRRARPGRRWRRSRSWWPSCDNEAKVL